MKKDIGWRILTSICVAVIMRPIVKDNLDYVVSCFFIGIVLGLIGEYLEKK